MFFNVVCCQRQINNKIYLKINIDIFIWKKSIDSIRVYIWGLSSMGPVPTAGASDGPVAAPWWLYGAGLRAVKYKHVVIVTQSRRW